MGKGGEGQRKLKENGATERRGKKQDGRFDFHSRDALAEGLERSKSYWVTIYVRDKPGFKRQKNNWERTQE